MLRVRPLSTASPSAWNALPPNIYLVYALHPFQIAQMSSSQRGLFCYPAKNEIATFPQTHTHTALVVQSPSGGHSPPAPRTYLFLTHCMPYLHISLTCALPSLAGTETHKGVTVIGCLSVAAEWSAHNSYSVSICQRMKAQPLTHRFIQQTPPEHLQSPLGPHPL